MYFTHRLRGSVVVKVVAACIVLLAALGAVGGYFFADLSALLFPHRRPPSPVTAPYQPSPTTGAGESETPAEPTGEPATTAAEPEATTAQPAASTAQPGATTAQPEATASEPSGTPACVGWVIAKFGGGSEGSYFVLVPEKDADRPSLEKLAENVRRAPASVRQDPERLLQYLRDDLSYIPYVSDTFAVPVSKAVYNSYGQFASYPCDAEASSTGK
ncbi:hypothetical protein [Actinomadura sp. WMMA1423]|uniref:hypothetical protein n=1 Tax=Actinomadura sp. WMMA1423 TaxID=2591108 RepID=UPI0011475F34|nr:hypothetical protein [Actinomadura sp. WMMA1423]